MSRWTQVNKCMRIRWFCINWARGRGGGSSAGHWLETVVFGSSPSPLFSPQICGWSLDARRPPSIPPRPGGHPGLRPSGASWRASDRPDAPFWWAGANVGVHGATALLPTNYCHRHYEAKEVKSLTLSFRFVWWCPCPGAGPCNETLHVQTTT